MIEKRKILRSVDGADRIWYDDFSDILCKTTSGKE